jgi:hypothetical protein
MITLPTKTATGVERERSLAMFAWGGRARLRRAPADSLDNDY